MQSRYLRSSSRVSARYIPASRLPRRPKISDTQNPVFPVGEPWANRLGFPGMPKKRSVGNDALRDHVRGSQHCGRSTVGRPKVHDGDRICPGCDVSFAPNSFKKHFATSHHRQDKSLEGIVFE